MVKFKKLNLWFSKNPSKEDAGAIKRGGVVYQIPDGLDDVIDGYEFMATLSFSTPLKILEMHGTRVAKAHQCIDYRADPKSDPYGRYGLWLPVVKMAGLAELEKKQASIFGQVNSSEVLPLLKAYRKIVESNQTESIKFQLLKNLTSANPEWKKRITSALSNYSHLGEYWAAEDLQKIKGIGPAKAKKLINQGIYSAQGFLDS